MSDDREGYAYRLRAHERAIELLQKDMADMGYDYIARVEMQLIISKLRYNYLEISEKAKEVEE